MAPDPCRPVDAEGDVVLDRFVDAIESLLRDEGVDAPVTASAAVAEEGSVLRARARQAQQRAAVLRERATHCEPADLIRHPELTVVHRALGLLMLTFGIDAVRATACLARLARRHRVGPAEIASRVLACSRPLVEVALVGPDGTGLGAEVETEAGTRTEPDVLRHALAFIHRHAGEHIGVVEIAEAAAISTRELQRTFRRHRDTTPLAYLRQARLEGAHLDLRAGDPHRGDTVASIASRWGFGHPGRFSIAYQECYEQPPSHTLRTMQPPTPARPPGP